MSLSDLPKTWLIDIDGTIFAHNSHLAGEDVLLPGTREFLATLPPQDRVILMTARQETYRVATEAALSRHGVRYDQIIFGLPVGERILINDDKPSGLKTAYAVSLPRNRGLGGVATALAGTAAPADYAAIE